MALNEHNPKRQYTRYKRHVNESNERVDALVVNALQDNINVQQLDTNQLKDTAFEERVYTIFTNNLYTNAMFVDYYKTGEYLNLSESNGVKIDCNKAQLMLRQGSDTGTAISTFIYSAHGNDIRLNDFFLIANEYVPTGAGIKYYLETSTGERWPILPNALKLPLHLSQNVIGGFKLVVEMRANALGESPVLNGYAVLYWDEQVERNYGMTNPDLMRFPAVEIGSDDGLTILIRDKAQDDKLVKVIEPLDTVTLTFDWNTGNADTEGRLAFVETNYPNYNGIELTQLHKLYYGPYVNSLGETEEVLQKIRQSTDFGEEVLENVEKIRNCPQCPVYETLSQELEELKEAQSGGSAV